MADLHDRATARLEPAAAKPRKLSLRSLRRWIRRIAIALLALLILLLGTVLFVLYTPLGTRLALQLALPSINALFRGEIRYGRLDGAAGRTLVLHDLEIVDADGTPAVRAKRVELELRIGALFRSRVDIRRLAIQDVDFTLHDGAGSVLVAKAFEPVGPSEPRRERSAWVVGLEDISIEGGTARERPNAEPMLRDVSVDAALFVHPDRLSWYLGMGLMLGAVDTAGLRLRRVDASTAGSLTFPDSLDVEHIEVRSGPHRVRAAGEVRGSSVAVHLQELRTDLGALRPVTGGAVLRGPARAHGDLWVSFPAPGGPGRVRYSADLHLASAGGNVHLSAAAATGDRAPTYAVLLRGASLRPGQVLDGLDGRLSGDLALLFSGAGNPAVPGGSAVLALAASRLDVPQVPVEAAGLIAAVAGGAGSLHAVAATRGGASVSLGVQTDDVLGSVHRYAAGVERGDVAEWAGLAGLPGLAGSISRARASGSIRLGEKGLVNATATVNMDGRTIRFPAGGAGQGAGAARVALAADLRWAGQGLPDGVASVFASDAAASGFGARTLDIQLSSQAGDTGAYVTASLATVALSLPGGLTVSGATASADGRVSNGLLLQRLHASAILDGLRGAGFHLRRAELRATSVPVDASDPAAGAEVSGTARAESLSLTSLGGLHEADARFGLTLQEGKPPVGQVTLSAKDLSASGQRLDTVTVSVVPDRLPKLGVVVTARRGSLGVDIAGIVGLPLVEGGPVDVELDRLQVSGPGLAVATRGGASVRYVPGGAVSVRNLRLRRTGQKRDEAALDGSFDTRTGAVEANVLLDRLDIASFARIAQKLAAGAPTLPELAGRLTVSATLSGTAAAPRAKVSLLADGVRIGALTGLSASGRLSLGGSSVEATLKARFGRRARVDLDAFLPLGVGSSGIEWGAGRPARLELDVRALDLAEVRPLLPAGFDAAGVVEGSARLTGPPARPRLLLDISASKLRLPQLEPLDATASVKSGEGAISASLSVSRAGRRLVTAALASASDPLRDLLQGRAPDRVARELELSPIEGSVEIFDMEPAALLSGMKELRERLRRLVASAKLQLRGPVLSLDVTGEVHARRIAIGSRLLDATLLLSSGDGKATGVLRVGSAGRSLGTVTATIPGPLGAMVSHDGLVERLVLDPAVRAHLVTEPLDAAGLERLVPGAGAHLGRVLAEPEVRVEATAAGSAGGLRLDLDGRASGRASKGHPVGSVRVLCVVEGGSSRAEVVVEQSEASGKLEAALGSAIGSTALLAGELPDIEAVSVAGYVRSDGLAAEPLAALLPGVLGKTRGILEVGLEIGGTLARPRVTGPVLALLDRLDVPAIGLSSEGIRARLEFEEDRVRLDPVVLRGQGGELTLSGTVGIPVLDPARMGLDGSLRTTRFPVLRLPDLELTMTGDLAFSGTVAHPVLRGDVTVDELLSRPQAGGRELQPIGPPKDVFFVEESTGLLLRPAASPDVPASVGSLVDLHIGVDIPDRAVRVTNEHIDVWAGGHIDVRTRERALAILGRVTVVEGKVELYGRQFVLQPDSAVVFTGSTELIPALDIRAHFRLDGVDLSAIGLRTDERSHILLSVTGTAREPKIAFSSDPDMSQTDILSIITVGFPVAGRGTSGVEGEAAVGNLLMSLAAQRASRMIQERLPVDIFKIETATDDLSAAKITVGQRIMRNLILTYAANLGAEDDENTSEVRLQYEITRWLHLDTRFGDAGAGGLDFVFRWTF